jgi:hypothetical protein
MVKWICGSCCCRQLIQIYIYIYIYIFCFLFFFEEIDKIRKNATTLKRDITLFKVIIVPTLKEFYYKVKTIHTTNSLNLNKLKDDRLIFNKREKEFNQIKLGFNCNWFFFFF